MRKVDTEGADAEQAAQAEGERTGRAETEKPGRTKTRQAQAGRAPAKEAKPKRQAADGQPEDAPAASEDFTGAIGSANERLQEVLQAADRAARQILEDARAEARRHVAEERERAQRVSQEKLDGLTARAEEIMRKAEAVGRRLDEFAAMVEAAIKAVSKEYGVEATPAPAQPRTPATGPLPAAKPGGGSAEGRPRRVSLFRGRQAAGVRPAGRLGTDRSHEIVARIAQWKSWGMSRARIEARLVEEFRVKNPAAVLDSLERSRPR